MKFLLSCVPVLAALAACGGASVAPPAVDAGASPPDVGVQSADAAGAPDAGAGSADAAESPDAGASSADAGAGPDAASGPALWVTGYIGAWNLKVPNSGGRMPASEVDYTAMTHAVLASLQVEPDGSLGWDFVTPDQVRAAVDGAHAAQRPILFSVGGVANASFAAALDSAASRTKLVGEIVSVLTTWGFDGVDLDLEPLLEPDEDNYTKFVKELAPKLALEKTPLLERPLLTAAVVTSPGLFASLAAYFDQINIMTYEFSGPWEGWVTWHNAPLFDSGFCFPTTTKLVPSADGLVAEYLAAGVPAKKLGLALSFYGAVWSGGAGTSAGGATEPRQSWTTRPEMKTASYDAIMETYFQPTRYHWDSAAEAAYLSIDEPGSEDDRFVSFDDATTAQKKVSYVRSKGIGGLMIWELSGGFRPNEPAGKRDALLQSVRKAAGY